MRHRVVITGLGAVTPIGLTVDDFWAGLMRGESGAGPITRFDASAHKTQIACQLKGFDPNMYMGRKAARRYDPFAQYGLAAAKQAVEDAGLDPASMDEAELENVGVILGTGIGGIEMLENEWLTMQEYGPNRVSPFLGPMMIANSGAGVIAIEYGFKGPNHAVVSACATGNHSLGDALLLLRHGYANVMLAGGAEATITPLPMAGFEAMKALSTRNDDPQRASRPFDQDRDGFVAGEGAGVLILETLEHAQARGATIHAEIVGYGASSDAYHVAAPDPEGRGVYLAMRRALRDADLAPSDVDYVNLHATSTPLGDLAETQAIKRVFGDHAQTLKTSSTKSMTGHLLGAAGAIEAIATILAIRNQTAPPTINLMNQDPACDLDYTPNEPQTHPIEVAASNAFGFGGHNTTVILRRFDG
ncbi:MAG: beta-ketoacyl-ACP synthase II [Bacteroidota bacterium]